MVTISAYEALRESSWAIVTRKEPRHVYGLYPDEDTASRICADLNRRYDGAYEVASIAINRDVLGIRARAEDIVRSLSLGKMGEGEAIRHIVRLATS